MRVRVGLVALIPLLATVELRAACDSPVRSDRWGRPLLDACGARLEYDGPRDEPWSLPATPAPPRVAEPRSFNQALMRDDATIGNFTQDLGTRGIHATDVDGDGIPEILVGHGAMWYLLGFDPSTSTWYQRLFREYDAGSTFGGGPIIDVSAGDVDGDLAPEIVVALSSGMLETFDGATGMLEYTQPLGVTAMNDVELFDIEGDAAEEIIVLTDSEVRVHALGVTPPLWTVPGVGGTDLGIGNVDLDAAKEIVIGGTAAGQVVDCLTRVTEWAYSAGFGSLVDVGDIDGDGIDEIAGCGSWGACRAVDGDTRVEKWSFDNFNTSSVRCRDVTGDGIDEVGLGDAQWGDVHFRAGATGALVSSIPNPEHSVAWIDYADVDGDCTGEVLWGAGYSSTGEDHIFVGDLATRTVKWKNLENDGPMHAFVVADIDADGSTEIVRACSESDAGYDGSLVFVTDLHHRVDEYVPTRSINDGWITTQGMAAVQADADPQLEYVLADSQTYDGYVGAFDGITHAQDWRSVMLDDGSPRVIVTGDPDEDGDEDLLIGTSRYFRVLQASDGAVLYRSPDVSGVGDIRVADVDADGRTEVVFLGGPGVRIYDGQSHFEEWFLPDTDTTSLDVADVIPGGAPEILVGDSTGTLIAYAGDGLHAELFRTSLGAGTIYAIRSGDVDGDSVLEIVLSKQTAASASTSVVKVLQASDRSVLWTSPIIVGAAGTAASLYVVDADDDGQKEICVSGSYTLRFFEHDDGLTDLTAPVFAGLEAASGIVSTTCCPSVDLTWTAANDDKTPPIVHEVHRGTSAGFTIDAASLIGRTDRTSYRDDGVASATTYWYAVRAMDGAGNVDANTWKVSITTEDAVPPATPLLTSVTDVEPCALSGVDVVFTPASAPAGTRFDLVRDGVTVQSGVNSPFRHLPGNSASHSYAIAAVKTTCDLRSVSLPLSASDAGTSLSAPVIGGIIDDNVCLTDGVTIPFTHAGFGGGLGRFDLLVDGAIDRLDVVSPISFVPPDAASHSYVIRAVDLDCTREADSTPRAALDRNRQPGQPTGVSITDVDPCAPSSARLRFTQSSFPAAGHYELWRDGVVYLSPAVDNQVIPVFDATPHVYSIVAVDDSCVLQTASIDVPYVDGVICGVSDTILLMRKFATAGEMQASWTDAIGDVVRYDAYVGTLAMLWGSRQYDHVADRTGLAFPDAPISTSGCDVASGTITSARIGGLSGGDYVLIVAVSATMGAGPFGARSDGIDRHDPSVDPRPASAFCP